MEENFRLAILKLMFNGADKVEELEKAWTVLDDVMFLVDYFFWARCFHAWDSFIKSLGIFKSNPFFLKRLGLSFF